MALDQTASGVIIGLTRLRQQVGHTASVSRDGGVRELPARDVVPGDGVQLRAGDLVPADARLLSANDLLVIPPRRELRQLRHARSRRQRIRRHQIAGSHACLLRVRPTP